MTTAKLAEDVIPELRRAAEGGADRSVEIDGGRARDLIAQLEEIREIVSVHSIDLCRCAACKAYVVLTHLMTGERP